MLVKRSSNSGIQEISSIHKNDLEVYIQKMSRRFYLIGGLNDLNLKRAFLFSILEPLGEETFRLVTATNKKISDTIFGELCQLIFKAIEKMCSQNKFLQEHIKQTKNLDKVCTNKELYTKCPTNPTLGCTCAPCSSKPPHRSRSKSQKMIAHIREVNGISLLDNEVESIISADEEINDQTLCALQLSDSDAETSQSDLDSEPDQEKVFQMNAINMAQKVPIIKMKVIPSKYTNPVRVAAFFDTGASYSIMNPEILPPAYRKKKKQFFHATNGKVLCIELIKTRIRNPSLWSDL
ncbi:hypothetical protein TIFTF001_027847 [Ficus carica]|uniref:Uncharacterized protein n=1 Tax=Ficus carica TaxID=3494 RepID=A0AA88J0Q4_FICCA|nr:hypothetical protein TIFTF001_027847 [Ficus carica]